MKYYNIYIILKNEEINIRIFVFGSNFLKSLDNKSFEIKKKVFLCSQKLIFVIL